MKPDQLPDSLQLRNLFRSLATLDLLVAPSQPSIGYQADPETHTQAATLPADDGTTWTALFTHDGATLTSGETTLASTTDQPQWQTSSVDLELPDLLNGTPESAQEWLAIRYNVRPDLTPIRQILMAVPLTIDLARELGNQLPWTAIREAVLPLGYPIPDEDLAGPDDRNVGANLD